MTNDALCDRLLGMAACITPGGLNDAEIALLREAAAAIRALSADRGEPVSVAQDVSDALDIVEMASSAVRGPYTSPELQEPLEQAHATLTKHIADHARRVAALVQAHSDARDVWHHWQGRAETAEASLAACRADAERWQWLRDQHASYGRSWHIREPSNTVAPIAIDAAIDAAMAVLPLAGEVAK